MLTFADGERYEGELKDGRMQVPATNPPPPTLATACQLISFHGAGARYLYICEWRPVRRRVEGRQAAWAGARAPPGIAACRLTGSARPWRAGDSHIHVGGGGSGGEVRGPVEHRSRPLPPPPCLAPPTQPLTHLAAACVGATAGPAGRKNARVGQGARSPPSPHPPLHTRGKGRESGGGWEGNG